MESEETLFTAKACLGKKVFKQYKKYYLQNTTKTLMVNMNNWEI